MTDIINEKIYYDHIYNNFHVLIQIICTKDSACDFVPLYYQPKLRQILFFCIKHLFTLKIIFTILNFQLIENNLKLMYSKLKGHSTLNT